jgi:glycosyltransferase involved in cell wall biosynthesis
MRRLRPASGAMKVTHVNTYDVTGGAARAVYRLHKGLCSAGCDSRMLVAQKGSDDSSVQQFVQNRGIKRRLQQALADRYFQRGRRPVFSAASPYFSNDRGENAEDLRRQLPATDILHLHWVARFWDSGKMFRHVCDRMPIIWTLHDMNPFTAGCHFDGGCGRYLERCHCCPQIGLPNNTDAAALSWQRKVNGYAALDPSFTQIVAPSRWLAEEARRSRLLGKFEVATIPYGVDTKVFRPRDRLQARELMEIPGDAKVVLFVADWGGEKRKGLDLLIEAVREIRDIPNLYILGIGRGIVLNELDSQACGIRHFRDDLSLSMAYSSADVLVVPSTQDNLPNTALEALACGVPTVAFAVGGLRDIVREGTTGTLVPLGDVGAMATAIRDLLHSPERRADMALECREAALRDYTIEIQARRYMKLYGRMLDRWSAPQKIGGAARRLD